MGADKFVSLARDSPASSATRSDAAMMLDLTRGSHAAVGRNMPSVLS